MIWFSFTRVNYIPLPLISFTTFEMYKFLDLQKQYRNSIQSVLRKSLTSDCTFASIIHELDFKVLNDQQIKYFCCKCFYNWL